MHPMIIPLSFLLAQTGVSGGPEAMWGSLTNLGAASAAVAVAWMAFSDRKSNREVLDRIASQFKAASDSSQQAFQGQLDELADRHDESQQAFQDQIGKLAEAQNVILRDAIVAMKSMEKTVDNCTSAIDSIQMSLQSLQVAVGAMDLVVRHTVVGARISGESKATVVDSSRDEK